MAPLLTTDLGRFLEGPISVYLGTRDADLRPRASRLWALRVVGRRDRLTAFGHQKAVRLHLPNLESNGQAAICLARPSDDRAFQVKGAFLGCREGEPKERDLVESRVQSLFENLELIGVPRSTFASWSLWPVLAISLQVTQVFCQTPGPGAGEALR